MPHCLLSAVLLLVAVCSCHCSAANWPQFRGPFGNGITEDAFPLQWDAESNVRWKADIAGEGWSAPVVWGDKLFLTLAIMTKKPEGGLQVDRVRPREKGGTNRRQGGRRSRYKNNMSDAEFRWEIHCLDTDTGDSIWKRVVREGKPTQGHHVQNTYATETPITDGERVYAYFGMNGLYCCNMEGELIWQKDPGNFEMRNDWGTSSSPVLHDDMLYLQIDSQEQSFLAAFDAGTGEQIWRMNRDEPSQYSSPVIWKNSVRAELVTSGKIARSYDPESGNLLWQLDLSGGRSSATPLAVGDRLYVGSEVRNRGSEGGGGYLFAVNAGAKGMIVPGDTDSIAWSQPRSGLQMASPVLCEGHLYLFERRRGVLHCISADTGEMVYEKRVPGARAFWSSPWVLQDKVFCLDDNGATHVIQGGSNFRVLHTNQLDEQVWSTPAIAGGAVFVRTRKSLYCIGP
ncbi:MAG: PQQ-like beta-propeller repeat protein [Fuerstiella sp.]|nr:PQQ-like beta-propeller repeat protein [Fuerstiella sp.]